MSIEINPKPLRGPWDGGYALDLHTLSSTPIGYDTYGHMQFDTKYSAVGGLLYRLKSKGDPLVIPSLVEAIESFWALSPRPPIDLIVPGAFAVDPGQTEGKQILLFDDLYRSGATVSTITNILKKEGKAKAVRLLTFTRTRSKS